MVQISARFLVECDTLSRYNGYTAELNAKRNQLKKQESETNGQQERKPTSVIREMCARPRTDDHSV